MMQQESYASSPSHDVQQMIQERAVLPQLAEDE
jgi:hypothetical protein